MKIANKKARQYVEDRKPFTGSNLCGKNIGSAYVVLSYNWYPVFMYLSGQWYENANRYSQTTAKQMSQCRPMGEIIKTDKAGLEQLWFRSVEVI